MLSTAGVFTHGMLGPWLATCRRASEGSLMSQAIESPFAATSIAPQASVSPEPHLVDEPIKQTLATIRCYNILRFIALPFFFIACSLLVRAFYDYTAIPRSLVVQVGIALSLIVGIFETVLSRNLIVLWKSLDRLFVDAPHWKVTRAHRHNATLWTMRWALFAPYPVALVFWLDQLLYYAFSQVPFENDAMRYAIAMGLALAAGAAMARITWQTWSRAEIQQEIAY